MENVYGREGDTLFPKAMVRSYDEAIVCSNMSGQVAEVMGLLWQSVEDRTDHHTFRAITWQVVRHMGHTGGLSDLKETFPGMLTKSQSVKRYESL